LNILNRNSSYFGLKDIYPSKRGNFSLDEITLGDDIFEKEINQNKQAGKSVNASDSKKVLFTMLGMLFIIIMLKKRGK